MDHKSILALTISSCLLASGANAANKVADARGNAMGNTGVATADYLTAPFYNPALVSSYKEEDDFGLFLSVGASVNDSDDSYNTIDDLNDFMDDQFDSDFDLTGATTEEVDAKIADINADIDELNSYLEDLDGNQLSVNAGVGIAIALPTKLVSTNLFTRGYAEVVSTLDVDTVDTSTLTSTGASLADDLSELGEEAFDDANLEVYAFGYAEIGLALAKEFKIAGERVSFGVTPKVQQMRTYAQKVTVDNAEVDDIQDSEITKTAVNFDLGIMWYAGNFRAGLAVKDLLAQKIDVKATGYTYDYDDNDDIIAGTGEYYEINDVYKLDTQVTLAGAYSSDYFTAALDIDLTKQTRFQNVDDDTQFVRLGLEGNAWGWAQLRAGYEIDLQDTLDNTITAGIGLSPFDLLNIDIAASYTSPTEVGVATTLAFTF